MTLGPFGLGCSVVSMSSSSRTIFNFDRFVVFGDFAIFPAPVYSWPVSSTSELAISEGSSVKLSNLLLVLMLASILWGSSFSIARPVTPSTAEHVSLSSSVCLRNLAFPAGSRRRMQSSVSTVGLSAAAYSCSHSSCLDVPLLRT